MKYTVATVRDAGLEARWARQSNGGPILSVRDVRRSLTWFVIDAPMWERAQVVGVAQAFSEHTALGHFFSVSGNRAVAPSQHNEG